jgi:hypothetical protein
VHQQQLVVEVVNVANLKVRKDVLLAVEVAAQVAVASVVAEKLLFAMKSCTVILLLLLAVEVAAQVAVAAEE